MSGTLLLRSSRALERSFADEVLLARPTGGEIDRLEGSAAVVWDLLAEPCSLDEVIATLARAYGREGDRIREDVEPLLRDLVERGWLLEIADADD